MSPELERRLCEAFPHLTRDYRGDPRQTCMAFGFDHGDGWYPILHRLLADLEALRAEYLEDEPPESDKHRWAQNVLLSQVKEKFGTLRVYTSGGYDERESQIVAHAEWASRIVCERCGSTRDVTATTAGYIVTLCAPCHAERLRPKSAPES